MHEKLNRKNQQQRVHVNKRVSSWVTRIVAIIVTKVNIWEHYAKIINMMNFLGLSIFQCITTYDICPIRGICLWYLPSRFNFRQWYAILLFSGVKFSFKKLVAFCNSIDDLSMVFDCFLLCRVFLRLFD